MQNSKEVVTWRELNPKQSKRIAKKELAVREAISELLTSAASDALNAATTEAISQAATHASEEVDKMVCAYEESAEAYLLYVAQNQHPPKTTEHQLDKKTEPTVKGQYYLEEGSLSSVLVPLMLRNRLCAADLMEASTGYRSAAKAKLFIDDSDTLKSIYRFSHSLHETISGRNKKPRQSSGMLDKLKLGIINILPEGESEVAIKSIDSLYDK